MSNNETNYQCITSIADLHAIPHWVVFAMVPQPDGKKPRKIPYTPGTDREARVNDPSTWRSQAEAVADAERTGRLPGVAITPAMNLTLLDVDGHIDYELVARFASYSEASVNGGLHILVRGRPPEGRVAHSGIEIYPKVGNRFLVLTGDIIDGRGTIADRTELLAELFPARPKPAPRQSAEAVLSVDDQVVLERVLRMTKGRQLHGAGDVSGYPSGSEADLALLNCYISAGASGEEHLNRLFLQSALYQARKASWDIARYRALTLARALDGTVQPYEGWTRDKGDDDRAHTVPPATPCDTERDIIAELRADNARLSAELTQVRADLAAVMQTLGNPNLGGDAAGKALVLAAAEVQHRSHSVPPGGFVQVNATRIADATTYVDGAPVSAPARVSSRTVTKYLRLASEHGLIDAKKDDIPAPPGKPGLENEGWYWRVAPTLADQLAPLTTGSVYTADNPRPLRGGDPTKRRRIKELPTCPACGGAHVACVSCGVMFNLPVAVDLDSGELFDAADDAAEHDDDRAHSVPPDDKDVSNGTVDVTIAAKFVSRDRAHTVPPGKTRRRAAAAADLQRRATEASAPLEPDIPPDAWIPQPVPGEAGYDWWTM